MGFQVNLDEQSSRDRNHFDNQYQDRNTTDGDFYRRINQSEDLRHAERVYCNAGPTRHTVYDRPVSCVIDINISVNVGGNNSEASIRKHSIKPRTSPIRSRAAIDDARFVDLYIRPPEHSAQLATDGIIRQSS